MFSGTGNSSSEQTAEDGEITQIANNVLCIRKNGKMYTLTTNSKTTQEQIDAWEKRVMSG